MNSSPKPGQIAILAGGAVLLIFSFLPWIDPDFGGSVNAWSEFGVFTWPALFGLIGAGTLAARLFGNVDLPEPVLTFTWKQIYLILAFTSVLITVGFMIAGSDLGIGFWLSLLGSFAFLAGAIMEVLDTDGATTGTSQTPPQSF